MKAVILAAGEGTRLRPLTLDKPKPMVPIAGRPLLEHTVQLLRSYGIRQIAINLHYKPQAIRDYFGDGQRFGVEITYSLEEQILGTAGAVRKLRDCLGSPFIVFYGDVLTNLDITRLVAFHKAKLVQQQASGEPIVTIALYRVENPSECGLVDMTSDGRITRFVEKPPPEEVFTDLANAGLMVVEPEIVDYIPPGTFYDFGRDLLPRLLDQGVPIYGYIIPENTYLIDIGTLDKYRRADQEWGPIAEKRGT